ncbi:MAG: hypothetical protein M1147_09530 [Nitrospirae bacterium]|nr:hypothetical protein [Nitrospirota bacterium]MCL5978336.1 hypothetical protein [Nitrospirota bacterium]
MNYAKWIFIIFLTFLLQTQFSFFRSPLTFTVVLAYYFALKSLPRQSQGGEYFGSGAEIKSAAFGAFIGLLEDILSGSVAGPNLFSKGLIGFIGVVAFTEVVFKWTPVLGIITIVLFTALDGIIVTGMRSLFTSIHINAVTAAQIIFIQALVNIPFGIILKPKKFRLTD